MLNINFQVFVYLVPELISKSVTISASTHRVSIARDELAVLETVSFSKQIYCTICCKDCRKNSPSEKRLAFSTQQVKDTITYPQCRETVITFFVKAFCCDSCLPFSFLRLPTEFLYLSVPSFNAQQCYIQYSSFTVN